MTLPRTSSAIIVGGGVVGCAIAYHLARRGMKDVLVLERETIGSGTTSKAAGGIRAQFSTETEIRFSLEAIGVFERFEEEFGVDPGYTKIGYLFLVGDPADMRGFEARIALQRRLGVDVRVITPDEAKKLVPALRVDDLIGAVWGPGDGLAGPAEVTSGFARRARELGVRIAEGVQVTGIPRDGDRVTGVTTPEGVVSAPLVIDAAGPSAARIARLAGVDVPVHPRRRHIYFTEPFPEIPGPVPLTTDRRSGFYFRKELEQILLSPGDVQDIGSDFDVPMDPAMMAEAVQKAVDRVPVLENARIAGGWAGLRPLTPDDHAIIGWAPGVTGFFLAVGFGGHGFQHSPATGRHVAAWIVDGKPAMDLSLFDPQRFADGRPGDGRPGDGRPGNGRPGDGRPGNGRPGDGRPGDGRPGDGRPGDGRPGNGRPGDGRPGDGRPGDGRPGDGRPGDGRPGNAATPISLRPPTSEGDTALLSNDPE